MSPCVLLWKNTRQSSPLSTGKNGRKEQAPRENIFILLFFNPMKDLIEVLGMIFSALFLYALAVVLLSL